MLYSRRKRLTDLADREAAGESFWSDIFDQSSRARLVHAAQDAVGGWEEYYALARGLILHDEGLFSLTKRTMGAREDLLSYLMNCDDEMVPTILEAISLACHDFGLNRQSGSWSGELFDACVNVILREHRISYDFTKSQMVPFSAKELHHSVLAPALQLLAGRPDLENVESAYRTALEEITSGKASDAITDAGTALQEMFSALGCDGNSLGPQIVSARAKGILAPHDSPMLIGVEKVVHWVSADRSEKGDAHGVTNATLDDAWFIVHIVGTVILRLSKTERRGHA